MICSQQCQVLVMTMSVSDVVVIVMMMEVMMVMLMFIVVMGVSGLNQNGLHSFICLNIWFQVGRTVGKDHEGYTCWGRYATGGALEVSKDLGHSQYAVCFQGVSSQLLLQCHACLPTAMLPTMIVMHSYPSGTLIPK